MVLGVDNQPLILKLYNLKSDEKTVNTYTDVPEMGFYVVQLSNRQGNQVS